MYPLADPQRDLISHLARNSAVPDEVPLLLGALLAGIQTVLHDNLLGVYLRGSLATGDFDAHTSDIDFLVVTQQQVLDQEFARLATMHAKLAQLPNRYAQQIEGAYLDRVAVQRFRPGVYHPTIYRGETLVRSEHHANWLLERWVVREQGVVLCGPPPGSLIDPISVWELKMAVRQRLRDWDEWANHPDDPDWLLTQSHQAYVIETMCRALGTLDMGVLLSKRQAVAWAIRHLAEPWRSTVELSQRWHASEMVNLSRNRDVMAFIHWVAAHGTEEP
jgi:predicted nucleotidyltransferase